MSHPVWEPKLLAIKPVNAPLMYLTGLMVLILNKLRRLVKQYSSPRPFSASDISRNVDYVFRVVNQWEHIARLYTGKDRPFADASILEIGPGPDLGTGILLLSRGVAKYHAIDLFPLVLNTPRGFYDALFDRIAEEPNAAVAKKVFDDFYTIGQSDRFDYQQIAFPSLTGLPQKSFDIIVSQAVWEHISDPEATLANLSAAARPGAVFLNVVDLSTHTRFIRDIDPLNMLRYGSQLYSALSFPGTPNRWRASDYENLSIKFGLQEVHFLPMGLLNREYVDAISSGLAAPYRKKTKDDLSVLSCWWLARFP